MTFVGKILTVLILVVSVAFLMLAAAVFATHRNWRDVVVGTGGLKQRIETVEKTNYQLREEATRAGDRLALEQAARRFALAALQTRLTVLEQNLRSSEERLGQEQQRNGELVETLNTNQIVLQKLTDEVGTVRDHLREARQARSEAFNKSMQLTDEVHRIEGTRQELQERYTQLLAQVMRMKTVLSRNGLTEFDPLDNKPPQVDGIVTAVGREDLIEISIGADDGLRMGHRLEVFRRNSYLGRIVIQRTEPDKAVGKILREYRKGIIKKGDRVATKLS